MSGLTPRHHWLLPAAHPVSDETIEEAKRLGLSARALRVLTRRGPVDPVELLARFGDPVAALHDPRLLPDAELVEARIQAARRRGESILVVGDFDADGLTGLAILTAALQELGLQVEGYVPHRTHEGHGLSDAAIEAARAAGHRLILTVDTGSSSGPEISRAAAAGIDVIVTDHHVLPEARPPALALVNPQRADSRYPDARLSGAGVAFKVAQLLLADAPGGPAAALELADLAAIGSVADVVPIAGENRAIIRLGLRRLATQPRPGLAALMSAGRIDPAAVDCEAIGYALAPRINAMGRVGDPSVAAALLLAADRATADALAAQLEAANGLRRELMAVALEEARGILASQEPSPFVVISGDWPVGIIGLLAGRIAEEAGRPALVLSRSVEPWRGSARSAGGFDLAVALAACGDLLERHGGHAAAAGCHVHPDRVAELCRRLEGLASVRPPADARPSLSLDLVQSGVAADHVLLREMAPLEDAAEPPPLVGLAGMVVIRARSANGGHTQLTLRTGRNVIDGISFGRADLAEQLQEGLEIDVVARLMSRTFAGLETLQLEIRDVAPAGWLRSLRGRTAVPLGALAS